MISNLIVPFIIMFSILFIVIMLVVNVLFGDIKDTLKQVNETTDIETITNEASNTNQTANVNVNATANTNVTTNTSVSVTTTTKEETLSEKADAIVKALKTQDTTTLAKYVNPSAKAGLRFSNTYNVQTKTDKFFTKDQVAKLATDPNKYTWGAEDGTGNSIVVTGKDYLTKYLYTTAFAESKTITYNDFAKESNTINNIREMYPKAFTIEYTTQGDNPEFDWKSLLLIFEEDTAGTWYLTGIAHNGWSI